MVDFLTLTTLGQAAAEPGYSLEDLMHWLGHWHLVVLHTPIGLISGLALLELVWLVRPKRREGLGTACNVLLTITTVSAAIAAALGWMLYDAKRMQNNELMQEHLIWGIATAVVLLVLLCIRLFASRQNKKHWLAATVYALGLMVATGMLVITGHSGGSSVHGPTFLYRGGPEWLMEQVGKIDKHALPKPKKAAPAPKPTPETSPDETQGQGEAASDATDATDTAALDPSAPGFFASQIQPIFVQHCYECHDPDQKLKGGFDMTTVEGLFAKGSSGSKPGITPGDTYESLVYMLAAHTEAELEDAYEDDFDFPPTAVMPPEDAGDRVSAEDLAKLKAWIESGASTD